MKIFRMQIVRVIVWLGVAWIEQINIVWMFYFIIADMFNSTVTQYCITKLYVIFIFCINMTFLNICAYKVTIC